MWFAIWATDVANSLDLRLAHRDQHRARLEQLQQEKRLLCAGPMPDLIEAEQFTGSLIVADFADLQAAQDWCAADPYQQQGVYQRVDIKPWRAVFCNAPNF